VNLIQGVPLTFSYQAVDGVGNTSNAATIVITLDSLLPTIIINAPNNGNNYSTSINSSVLLSGIVSTNATTMNLNGSPVSINHVFNGVSTTWSALVNLAEGANTFTVSATNANGTNSDAITITLDTVTPGITITTNGGVNFATNNATVVLRGAVSTDATSILLNGSAASINYTLGNAYWSATVNLVQGVAVTFDLVAYDGVGHKSATASIAITLSSLLPTIIINAPNSGNNYATSVNSSVLISGIVSSNVTTMNLNGSPVSVNHVFNGVSTTWSALVNLVEGANTFTVFATNPAGTNSDAIIITLDTVTPGITITTNGGANFSTTNTTVTLRGAVSIDATTILMNGSAVSINYTLGNAYWAATVNLVQSSTVTFDLVAFDLVGHKSVTASIAITQLNNSAVLLVITTNAGADFTTINSTLTLRGTVSSNAVTVNVNSSTTGVSYNASSTTWSAVVNLVEGANLFNVAGINAAGTTGSADTITITLDTTPPPPITGLVALPGNNQAAVSWTRAASPTATGTLVLRATQNITWQPASQNAYILGQTVTPGISVAYVGAAQAFTDGGVLNGTQYFYAAYAYDGVLWYSTFAATANVIPTPSAISGLQIFRNTVNAVSTKETITLTWSGPSADVYSLTNTFNAAFTGAVLMASGVNSGWIDSSANGATVNERYYQVVDAGAPPNGALAIVGKYDFLLLPGTITNISSPLIVSSTNANEVLGQQINPANNDTDSDWVGLGAGINAHQYYRGYALNWWENSQAVVVQLLNGQGFVVGIRPANATADITVVGSVANSTVNVAVAASDLTILGRSYPLEIDINSSNLGAGLTSASNATQADKIICDDGQAWLSTTGVWYTGNDPSTLKLKPGKAYKLEVQGAGITWQQRLQ
jgi:hypothetical protein